MIPLELTHWFRRRMIPLVIGAFLTGSLASPAVYYLQKRHEVVVSARVEASRVGAILQDVILQSPVLWRYDTSKIAERLLSEGLGQRGALVVHDARGECIPLRINPSTIQVLWGRSDVFIADKLHAQVWIGFPTDPIWVGTATVGIASSLVSAMLGLLLYLIPTRAIAAAEQRITTLVARLSLTLREEERGRIARDLHDGAGQALTAARLQLTSLRKAIPQGSSSERLSAAVHHIDEAMEEIRRSTAALRPPALAELGLQGALERHAEAIASASGIDVSLSMELPDNLQSHVETSLYRIIQEALTNVVRHSGATRVQVTSRMDSKKLQLSIQDNGQGLAADLERGGGLRSIEERARSLGGDAYFVEANPGLRVEVVLPMEDS